MENIRYGSLKISANCSKCDSLISIAGPRQELVCDSCQKTLKFSEDIWDMVFQKLDHFLIESKSGQKKSYKITLGNQNLNITMKNELPTCFKCKSQLDLSGVASFSDEINCICGEETTYFGAPSWLEDSQSIKLIGTPPVLNSFSTGSVSKPSKWYVRFQGTLKWYLRKQRQDQIEIEEKQNRKQKQEFERGIKKLELKINQHEQFSKANYRWGYLAALMIGVFAIGFPIIFIPPLSRLVGEKVCDGDFIRKTSRSNGETSINFYCKKDNVMKPIDGQFMLFGPGAGILFASVLWTCYIPVLWLRTKKKIAVLEAKLENLKRQNPSL